MTDAITTEMPEENDPAHNGMLYGVSGTKLIIMSIYTLSLYNFYWFYKSFELSRIRYDDETIPLARALFSRRGAASVADTIDLIGYYR